MAKLFKVGITAEGDVSLTGKLYVNASGGDEGGEIFLKKPVTNTSISGGVNIDVYQDKLRIWEDSGTNRGVYIDMTAAGAGVGTNLLGTATDTNYYPSAIVFNAGTTAGPTLDLTMSGSGAPDLTAVAIPSASGTASGVVTTGSQTFAGTKTFSSTISGSITGNAGTVTNGVYTTDTGTVTNTMLAGSIANAKLANSSVLLGSQTLTLGAAATTALSGLTGVSSTTFTSTVITGTAPFTVASTTMVTNLNADLLEGYSPVTTNTANSIVLRDGSGNFSAGAITGTSFNSITGLSSTTPSASGTAAVGTATTAARADHVHPTTGLGLTSGTLAQFAATTSAQLAGVISDETGSGALVFANNPSLTAPSLGVATGTSFNSITGLSATTPAANGAATVGTSTEAARADHVHPTTGLGVTTSGLNQFAATTSAQLAGVISDETGSGALVFATSPTLVTPSLGVATGTSFNKMSITAPSTGSTLAIADLKTFTVNNTITLNGTDSRTYTFPTTNATLARTDAAQTFTGTQTFSSSIDTPGIARSGTSALALSTAAAATSTGAISLTSGNVTSSGTSGAVSIDVGSSVGGGGPGAVNIGTTNASAVNVKNLKVINGGVFEYSGYSTSTGSTTLTNVPGTTGYATSLPSILTSVLTSAATTNTGSVGAEFRASATTTTHLITFSSGTTARGSISTNSTTTTYSTSSDYRLKENVQPIVGATERLMLLKPSRFNFIEFPDRVVDGFIAHEAQEVVPESVVGDKDETNEDGSPAYQGIDQGKLVPLLTAALQESVREVEDLKTVVSSLLSRIEALEAQ